MGKGLRNALNTDKSLAAHEASQLRPNYRHDPSAGAYAVRVCCYICGTMSTLAHMVSDLDGPAFKAYYHVGCLPENHGGTSD